MSARQEATRRIEALLTSGLIPPGGRLPSERSLAERLGVSRGSVREAVRALAARGLVRTRPGAGTYLAERASSPLAEILAASERIDSKRLRDVFGFRRMLEPAIAAEAAVNASPADIDRLKVIVCDQQRRLLADQDDADLDAAFHRELARASANAVVLEVMEAVSDILAESRRPALRGRKRRQQAVAAHLKLIDALERRDAQACAQAMRQHLGQAADGALTEPTPSGKM